MKKPISLIMCAAILFSFIPKVTFAAETQKQAAKLGIEKGDIISYAGKDNMPIKWRVIDADKDNTGKNSNGMLLLSEDTAEEIADNSMKYALDRLKSVYTDFYNKYFTDFYKNAVIPTTDTGNKYSPLGFVDELDDDTVFSLSKSEAEKLSVEERKYKGKKWVLRSVRQRKTSPLSTKYDFSYVDSSDINSAIDYAEISNSNKNGYYFRPAVNIDKTKLAQLDGKPILLPAGEYAAANSNLAALGTSSEWKLVQNNDIKITKTNVAVKDNGGYTITADTDIAAVDSDDYISLIIKKSDGSISHYGRYAMAAPETTFDITLPDGWDNINDTAYVFYENYKGVMSGSAGELTKICLHEYSCTSIDDNTHMFNCTKCGDTYTGNHIYDKITADADKNVCCTVCDKQEPFMVKEVNFDAAPEFNGNKTAVRTEYDINSIGFKNCVTSNIKRLFDSGCRKELSYIPTGEKAAVTFKTLTPIRATGFRIVTYMTKNNIPDNITLYGRSNSSEEYKKIGSAFLKSILREEKSYLDKTYAFLFTDSTNFAAYNDFKFEMDNDSANVIDFMYLGLLSDNGSSFTFSADGAITDGFIPSNAYPNEDLTLTLISKNGHPQLSEIIFTINGEIELHDPIHEYSPDTGIFNIPGNKIEAGKEYVLNVKCDNKTIDVNFELNRATVIEKTENPELGQNYSCVFRDANGETTYAPSMQYAPLIQDIQVLCGGNDITENCKYTNYTLNIPGKYVLSDITIVANEKFSVQNNLSKVRIDKPGEPTRWYDDYYYFSEMLKYINTGGNVTVSLIRKDFATETISKELTFTAGDIIFDLNRLSLSTGPITVSSDANLTIKNGTYSINKKDGKTIVDSGAVLTLENVSATTLSINGKLIANNANNKTISDVSLQQGSEFVLKRGKVENLKLYQPKSTKIYNGTIGTISSYADDSGTEALSIKYNELLCDGCEFYNITSQEAFDKGEPTGFSVRCLHKAENIDLKTGICICGEQVNKILTVNGENMVLHDDIFKAIEYANQNPDTTIRIFCDIKATIYGNTVKFGGINTTLDLNGKTLEITGEKACIALAGSLTVTGNGVLNTLLNAKEGSALTIENGSFKNIFMATKNVTLNGGKFTKLEKSEGYFSEYLGKDMAYRYTDTGKFTQGTSDVIENVEVTDIPFVITSQLKDRYLDAGTKYENVSIDVKANESYKDKIVYKWSVWKEDSKSILPYVVSDTSAYPDFSILLEGLDEGTHLNYSCMISCDDYTMESNEAVLTIGKGTSIVDTDSENNYVVDTKGNDCVLIAAAYSGNRLLGMTYKKLTKESGILKLNDILPISEIAPEKDRINITETKIFFWDNLEGMIPIGDSTILSNEI